MKKVPQHIAESNRKAYNRYMRVVSKARKKIHTTADKAQKAFLERELCYLNNHATQYGFNFFPNFYVMPAVEEFKKLLHE